MAYWALAEVVRQRLQVAEDDDSAVAAARLTEGLVRWVPDPGDREYIGLRLARLLGVSGGGDAGPALGREELFAGWRRFFERLASTAPVTLLIEDLHSASSDLLDFLDHLVDWSRDLPIFVLAFARSELEAQRPGFGTGHNRVTIALDPLDEASMDAIVDALVPDMPPAARQRITERAQGIPLYAMESIRSLIDSGVIQRDPAGSHRLIGGAAAIGELAVPDSLRALLAARLDALDPVARRVVADASVLGARFPAEALVALSGLDETEASGVLAGLLRREVLQVSADPLSPQRGSYGFTQEMLRQVAYDTLSRRDRKSRHLAVARHLRTVFPNDGEEVIDAVARHYQDALDAEPRDPDAPEIRQVLVETLVRAAERSIRTGAPTRAAEAYVAAADQVTDSDPLRAANLLMCAASTSTRAVDQGPVTDIAERVRVLAAGVGERRLEAAATALLGRARRRQGRFAEARDLLNTALSVLRTDPGPDTLEALDALGPLEVHAGTPAAAGVLEEAMALANRLGADDARFADILLHYGLYFHFQGNLRLAALYQRGAIGHYEAAGATYESIYAYINLADVLLVQDARASIEASLRALELSVQTGATYPLGRTVYNLACAHLQLDDWDLADAALHHPALDLVPQDSWVLGARAQLHALRGEVATAEADFGEVGGDLLGSEDPQDRSFLAVVRAALALARGEREQALAHARDSLVHGGGALAFGGDDARLIWPIAARLCHELGRYDEEADLLAMFDRQARGAVAPLQIAEAQLISARLAAAGDDASAVEQYGAAIEAMRRLSTPHLLAHGLLDHAGFLLREGEASAVPALVDEARAIARKLRCKPLLDRADELTASRVRTPLI